MKQLCGPLSNFPAESSCDLVSSFCAVVRLGRPTALTSGMGLRAPPLHVHIHINNTIYVYIYIYTIMHIVFIGLSLHANADVFAARLSEGKPVL